MLEVQLTLPRRRWSFLWRRRFSLQVPTCWDDLGDWRARHYWFRKVADDTDGTTARALLLRQLVPTRWRALLSAEQYAAIAQHLQWLRLPNDCSTLPLPEFRLRGVTWHLPTPEGNNVLCGEFAVCDDLYKRVLLEQDTKAWERLTLTLYRPADTNVLAAAKRGDKRVPFFSLDETDLRLQNVLVPPAMMQAALIYFSGLKQWIHSTYGSYIFEATEEEEPKAEQPDGPPQESQPKEPNFEWWGILQAVAESGVFGPLEQVYQSSLHEVCIFLVRKRVEADRLKTTTTRRPAHDDLP